jgi:hypothetical protein
MKSNGVVLTVDWDFFVPEDPMWDIQHKEALFWLDPLWSLARMNLIEEMITNGQECGFWDWVRSWADIDGAALFVSDSHSCAYPVVQNAKQVILVDAHHDCWPSKMLNVVQAHDWLGYWLEQSPSRKAIWIHPDDAFHSAYPLPLNKINVVSEIPYKPKSMENVRLDVIHVCRSGCWTPPWLDQAFVDFLAEIEAQTCTAHSLQSGEWDPTKLRWTEQELIRHIENYKKQQEMLEE